MSLLETCPLVRGRIKGIHNTWCQIILSLLERCPLARVSFKRGSTVYPIDCGNVFSFICIWAIMKGFCPRKALLIHTVEPLLKECSTGHDNVVSKDRWSLVAHSITLNIGPSAGNMCSFKTCGLSWQWSLKTCNTVLTCVAFHLKVSELRLYLLLDMPEIIKGI